jgi:hypothetical protein
VNKDALKGRAADFMGRDNRQHYVYRRCSEQVVRFSEYHPNTNPEGFFYNMLLDQDACHFRAEGGLLTPNNKAGTFFNECFLRGIFKSQEDLELLVQQYGQRHMYRADQIGQTLARLKSMFEGDQLMQLGPDEEEEQGAEATTPEDRVAARAEKRAEERIAHSLPTAQMLVEDFQLPAGGGALLEEQQRVFDAVTAMQGGFVLLTGGPGSGKTYLTKRLALHFRQKERKVLFSASTGAAAMRLSRFASTNHSTFHIPVYGAYMSLPSTNVSSVILRAAQVIFIDEM